MKLTCPKERKILEFYSIKYGMLQNEYVKTHLEINYYILEVNFYFQEKIIYK